jgi:predicted nuclease of predicted toxin-antitoxin system
VKFLLDAHLPRRLAHFLSSHGHEALHTLDMPDKNYTTDDIIISTADAERRVVVTKDSDFVASFHVARMPRRLLLVSTGNINNSELEELFNRNLDRIVDEFATHDFIELSRTHIIVHV